MTVRVRRLEAGDKAAWLRLFREYIDFYRASVPDEVIELTWTRLMAGEPDFHLGLVAVDGDGQPIGLALILFHRSTWAATHYCYLEDLYVDRVHRGSGVGRALIEAVYREADQRGATRTYWVTEETNHAARALYDRVARKVDFVQYRRQLEAKEQGR